MEKTKRKILAALMESPRTYWELITLQDRHLADFVGLIRQMMEEGLVEWPDYTLQITPEGRRLLQEENIGPLQPVTCGCCQNKTVQREGIFEEIYLKMRELLPQRPVPLAEYDQGPVELETLVSRIVLMYNRGDLEGQRLFLLGDDDLTSIAAGLTGMPAEITVVEADSRLVEFIQSWAVKEGFSNFYVRTYDVRNPFPQDLEKKFDTFFVDPVETMQGIALFITRCVQAMKGTGAVGYFGLTHLEASRQKWHKIQRCLLEMNLVITDILHNFQWYELDREKFVKSDYPLVTQAPGRVNVPEKNWYSSNLYRVEAVGDPKPLKLQETPQGRDFYFDDEAYATLP